jgi:hypothetical protein
MRAALTLWVLITALTAVAQWESIAGGMPSGLPYDLIFDSLDTRLYVMGNMDFIGSDEIDVNGTAYYSEASWHPMRSGVTHQFSTGLVPEVKTVCRFDSSLIVAGSFYKMDSLPNTSYVAEWRDDQWHSMGIDSSEQELGNYENLVVLDNQLNLTGNFTWDINGPIWSWAVWDGESWSPGDTTGIFLNMQIKSLCEYQGQIYAGGNFNNPGFPSDIARWNTDHWEEVGGGINGDPWVNDLAVYDNKLWVCGEFAASWGNAASGLMAWDGQQWLNPFPQIAFIAMGRRLQVANGKLYFVGPFLAQGLPGVYHFGVFDGTTLCVFGGNDLLDADKMCVAPDTLFAYVVSDNFDVNRLGKWPLNAPMDMCYSVVQGEAEPEGTADQLVLFPNPVSDDLRITLPFNLLRRSHSFRILDMLGQEVMRVPVRMGSELEINVSGLSEGTYAVLVMDANGMPLAQERFVHLW